MIVSIQYEEKVKQFQVHKKDLTWTSFCQLIGFYFPEVEGSRFMLKYKDIDNDEITVNSDEDLIGACDTYAEKKAILFQIHCQGQARGRMKSFGEGELNETVVIPNVIEQAPANYYEMTETVDLRKDDLVVLKDKPERIIQRTEGEEELKAFWTGILQIPGVRAKLEDLPVIGRNDPKLLGEMLLEAMREVPKQEVTTSEEATRQKVPQKLVLKIEEGKPVFIAAEGDLRQKPYAYVAIKGDQGLRVKKI
eukprot:TRINITY_DN5099_c0_g1_i2.p1 TRINITY_DN5099_c0_g1~~TRINITY_DN5099_c0_g1_i2.p1  ORF type:complete len:250 (+),score=55.86 TRINITY_DN5099_c0_g1_i2:91-840(+)